MYLTDHTLKYSNSFQRNFVCIMMQKKLSYHDSDWMESKKILLPRCYVLKLTSSILQQSNLDSISYCDHPVEIQPVRKFSIIYLWVLKHHKQMAKLETPYIHNLIYPKLNSHIKLSCQKIHVPHLKIWMI